MGANTQAKNVNFSAYQIEDNLKQKWIFNLSDVNQPGMRSTNSQFSTLSNCQSFMQRFSQASSASQLQRLQTDVQKRTKIQAAGSSNTLAALLLSGSLTARASTAQGGAMSVYIPVREKEPADVVEEVDASADEEERGKQEVYDLHLEFLYSDDQSGVEGVDYKVTLSDGSVRAGRLGASGKETLHDVPTGMHEVVFGDPEAESNLEIAREELQGFLDEVIEQVTARAKQLDEFLSQENIAVQGLVLTGAFFDGLLDSAIDLKDMAAEMALEAKDKLDKLDELPQKFFDIAVDLDAARKEAFDILQSGDIDAAKEKMEELATYAEETASNIEAYAKDSFDELSQGYDTLALLFTDEPVKNMLTDFPARYTGSLPMIEQASMAGGAGFSILISMATGGAGGAAGAAGAAASLASKAPAFGKAIDKIGDITELLKKAKLHKKDNKGHNETSAQTVEKPKEEELDEKDKKKCGHCGDEYDPKCAIGNKARQKEGSNTRTQNLKPEITKTLREKVKSGTINIASPEKLAQYPQDHPWYTEPGSLEVHHLISVGAVKGAKWKKVVDACNYDINKRHNLIVLPKSHQLACQLGVVRHHSNHDTAHAEYKNAKTYEKAVNKITKDLLNKIDNGTIDCTKSKKINKLLTDRSLFILRKLDSHSWVLANEGLDYDYKSYKDSGQGCQNAVGVKLKCKQEISPNENCNDGRQHKLKHKSFPHDKPIQKNDAHKSGELEIGS